MAAGDVLARLGGTAADNALADAAMAVESAQLSLRRAQEALEDYTITSPISGTVIEKNFKAGDKMDGMEAGALAVIYDLSALELELRGERAGHRLGPSRGRRWSSPPEALPRGDLHRPGGAGEHQRHHHRRLTPPTR